MKHLVISCSASPDSRSRVLAHQAADSLRAKGAAVELLDLSMITLPLCDGGACYDLPEVQALTAHVAAASGILIAAPVYNFDLNAAAKNLVELTGKAWENKIVGFLCAAGGNSSYMSVMPFANSLMLDFRCLIIPRFVYAPYAEDDDEDFGRAAIGTRIEILATDLLRLTTALAGT
jgi:FMN reductase